MPAALNCQDPSAVCADVNFQVLRRVVGRTRLLSEPESGYRTFWDFTRTVIKKTADHPGRNFILDNPKSRTIVGLARNAASFG